MEPDRPGLVKRLIAPAGVALAVFAISRAIFVNADIVESRTAYHAIAVIFGLIHFVSVAFMPSILYPAMFFRGASPTERIIAASLNPLLLTCIEAWNVSASFGFLKALYWGANVALILMIWSFTQMGCAELVCRQIARRRGQDIKTFTPIAIVPMVLFVLMIVLLSRQGGAFYFNTVLSGYRILFH